MLTERDTSTETLPDYNSLTEAPEPKPKRKRAPRRRARTEEPVAAQSNGQVKVNASFSVPVEHLANFAQPPEEEEDDEEEIQEVEEVDPRNRRYLLYGDGLASVPFQPRVAPEDHSESVREHLRQVSEASAFKARIWGFPAGFAQRNPIIQRKPKVAPGWAMRGEIEYDPETLETDLLALFSDGYYFVEIRERGQYRSGQMVTVGDPSSPEVAMTPTAPPTIIHEPLAQSDPVKEATAQAKIVDTVIGAATRLLEAQTGQQPTQSLKDRLEEFEMMKRIFAPPPQPAPPVTVQSDPIEKLANTLESEAFKRVMSVIKSDNPAAAPVEQQTTFWDFAVQATEFLAPGLNALLPALGQMIANYGGDPTPPTEQPKQVNPRPQPPKQQPPQTARPTLPTAPVEAPAQPETEAGPEMEEEGLNIQFLVADLLANEAPQVTAGKVKAALKNKPLIRPFFNEYLNKSNDELFSLLIGLCENEQEAATMREGLQACTWKDTWLNSLKDSLKQ